MTKRRNSINNLMVNDINKNLPRDTFMHLLAVVALIVSAISFGALLFQYTNIYFPDALSDNYWSNRSFYDLIRRALAALIVVFPVYVWVSWFLNKDIKQFPEKTELKIRKWLLYLTVFAAALVIIGDLVILIQTYLNGELTARFLLKVASVFFIAGAVFYYYFLQLKIPLQNGSKTVFGSKIFMLAIIGIVAATVVFGFFIAGSPQSRRLERLDERRISDLSVIQSQVIDYWQRKSKLPVDLDSLAGSFFGVSIPNDPKTKSPYEYKVLSNLKFELCAVFETVNAGEQYPGGRAAKPMIIDRVGFGGIQDWQHDLGRTCFETIIDPEIFKSINKF